MALSRGNKCNRLFCWAVLCFCTIGRASAEEAFIRCAAFLHGMKATSYQTAFDLAQGHQSYNFLLREFAYHMDVAADYAYLLANDKSVETVLQRYSNKLAMLRYLNSHEGQAWRKNMSRKMNKKLLAHFKTFYPLYLKEMAKRVAGLSGLTWAYQEFSWHGREYPALIAVLNPATKFKLEAHAPAALNSSPPQSAQRQADREVLGGLALLDFMAQRLQQDWQRLGIEDEVTLVITEGGAWNDPQIDMVRDIRPPHEDVLVEGPYFFLPWYVFDDVAHTLLAFTEALQRYRLAHARILVEGPSQAFNFAAIDGHLAVLELLKTAPANLFKEDFRKAQRQATLYNVRRQITQGQKLINAAIAALQNAVHPADLTALEFAYNPVWPQEDVHRPGPEGGYVFFNFSLPASSVGRAAEASYTIKIPLPAPGPGAAVAIPIAVRRATLAALRQTRQDLWALQQQF